MTLFDTMFPLGIEHYLAGGLLIGLGVSFLFLATGLIGGASTFFTATLSWVSRLSFFQQARFVQSRNWRLIYASGLVLGALIWTFTKGSPFVTEVTWWQLSLGGFIAGFGARMSNGCTSGHGICGMASLQMPSILAVIIFMTTGILAANLVHLLGGV